MKRPEITLIILVAGFVHGQNDEINIESTVTGNQEQPNVLTIVPWKQADDLQVIEQSYDEQLERIFPHLEPSEFARHRTFADDLKNNPTPELNH